MNIHGLLIFLITVFFVNQNIAGQPYFEQTSPSTYRVVFTDKDNNPFTLNSPEAFLSSRSLERRQNQNIGIDYTDIPVTPAYIDSIKAKGAQVLTVSKWFNSLTIKTSDTEVLERISWLPFVQIITKVETKRVKRKKDHNHSAILSGAEESTLNLSTSIRQLGIHNGQILQNNGYKGQGMIIAVLDAGFYHVDALPAFDHIWSENRILGSRDFVEAGNNVYTEATHGMYVFSIIGGYLSGELTGTAPEAEYWLLRTEDIYSEYVIEEDNWIAAAEFADSAGVDIITTSLGYTTFDDASQDHSYDDLNGHSIRISRAANYAASKGILVVASAGNEGNDVWQYITAPADADSILAVGAVDENGYAASFSSRGPTSDGRIKPDVMAIGKGTVMASVNGGVQTGNGTSLAAPVISGLAACLWQANRDVTSMQLLETIKKSADRFEYSDNMYGYGIPDFNLANVLLKLQDPVLGLNNVANIYPNPFRDDLIIVFREKVGSDVDISIYDMMGRWVFHKLFSFYPGREYLKLDNELSSLNKGMYIVHIKTGPTSSVLKLIKR